MSGSGKSTLIEDVLWRAAARALGQDAPEPGAHRAVRGLGGFDRVALVDQTPVMRSFRSNPVTYVKAFDRIRERYARTPLVVQGPGAGADVTAMGVFSDILKLLNYLPH